MIDQEALGSYLGLTPSEIAELTPRETSLLEVRPSEVNPPGPRNRARQKKSLGSAPVNIHSEVINGPATVTLGEHEFAYVVRAELLRKP